MKNILWASLVVLAACGPAELRVYEPDYVDHDLAESTAGLNAGAAGGCDTGIVSGLTKQLIAELNCITPNTMIDFSKPNISKGSQVNPFLAPSAASALWRAVNASGTNITLNSAYRSVAQQYLLYKWWQAGQCSIQIAAAPGKSNHQSGRAIDVQSYSFWISRLQAQGWKWYGSGDIVHFDYNGAANIGSKSVLAFQRLWNKNSSSKLTEDGVWGPASQAKMALAPTTGFPVSGCAVKPPPPPVTTGTLKGLVYEAGDTAKKLAGATVKVDGKTLTTDAAGGFSLTMNAGTASVVVTKAGYSNATVTKAVVAGATATVNVAMTPVGMADTVLPVVELTAPEDKASVEEGELLVTGTASDNSGAVASLTLAVNGGVANPIAVSNDLFTTSVKLKAGANALVFVAKDKAGNVGTLKATLNYKPGIDGVVTTDGEVSAPIEGVQVRLTDETGLTAIASATTAADGSYALEVPAVGNYVLFAQAEGFAPYRAPVTVEATGRLTWSFSLSEGSTVDSVRILYPRDGETVLARSLTVSGQVNGFAAKSISVNGIKADFVDGQNFSAQLELAAGDNFVEAIAEKADGTKVNHRITVKRVDTTEYDNGTRVAAGCSAAGGNLSLFAVLGLFGFALRRKSVQRG